MNRLTEFLLLYDLPLLAAANEQRGSAWINEKTGVDVDRGVLARDELLLLQHFEQAQSEELRAIWRERDQQPLLDLAGRLKSARKIGSMEGDPVPARAGASLTMTVLMLFLALLGAIALVQLTADDDSALHDGALFVYLAAIVLLVLGSRLGRYLWRAMRRGAGKAEHRDAGG